MKTQAQPDMTKQFKRELKQLTNRLTKSQRKAERTIARINKERTRLHRQWEREDKKLASQVDECAAAHTTESSAIQHRIKVLEGRLSA